MVLDELYELVEYVCYWVEVCVFDYDVLCEKLFLCKFDDLIFGDEV